MLKVAILDDYQNVSEQFVDLERLSGISPKHISDRVNGIGVKTAEAILNEAKK